MLNPNLLATMLTPLNTAPAPAPAPAPSAEGEPGAFGRELQRAEKASQGENEPKPAHEPRSDQAAAERQRSERRAANATERRPTEPAKAVKAKDSRAEEKAAGNGDTATAATTSATARTDDEAPDELAAAVDPTATPGAEARPDIASWLAQMAQRLELARERGGASARGTAKPTDGSVDAADAGKGTESGLAALADTTRPTQGSERLPAAAADRARGVGARAEAQASPTATAVLAAQSEARAAFGAMLGEAVAAAATSSRPDTARVDGAAALAAVAASAAPATGSDAPAAPTSAALAEDTIAPPVGSREFAQALGARVAVFARDGIEHARLNLNPAELGPISLQLALDGTQLRVDMAAEAAQTRQVLEQSLPGLASALRDAGLTLSGGGVFQQARDGSNGFGEPAQAGRSGTRGTDGGDGGTPEPALVTRPVRLDGLVDLYA
jgi:flagellar hook-length control protein FliK